jgi:sulfide dehydrogenase cytochrome subunit
VIAGVRIGVVMAAAAVLIACGWTDAKAEGNAAGARDLDRAATLAAACAGCHGKNGNAIVGLGGRSAEEIQASLTAYHVDAGGTSVMHRIARGYSDADIRLIAAHLAAREGR